MAGSYTIGHLPPPVGIGLPFPRHGQRALYETGAEVLAGCHVSGPRVELGEARRQMALDHELGHLYRSPSGGRRHDVPSITD
jgi:hypothetical protein